jgi:hypothetical protein
LAGDGLKCGLCRRDGKAGVKRQTALEGRPPVQAKIIVELKPPVGVAVSVTGVEVWPRTAVAEAVEGERVKAPTGLRMVRVTGSEMLP